MENNENLEQEKKKLENEVLRLQIKHYDRTKKQIYAIGTLIISVITVAITVIQIWTAKIGKDKELELAKITLERATLEKEREYKLDLAKFISDNKAIIFSDDTNEQKQIMNVMAVTFPPEITKATFNHISKTKDTLSRQVWQRGVEIADEIMQYEKYADVTIHYYRATENDDRIAEILKKQGLNVNFEKSKYKNINTIWISSDIEIELIRSIAKTIIENGEEIELITYFKTSSKNNLINIGNHGSKKHYQPIELNRILDSDDFITIR